MKEWYDYVKYIGTIVMLIPILFLFQYPITFVLYIIGIFVNIVVNYIIKKIEKQLPPMYQKRNFVKKKMEKYNLYEYNLYAFPSEKIQNMGYSIGFIGTYLAQNRKKMKDNDIYIITLMIFLFYIIVIVTCFILYNSKHNSIPQMLTGKGIGVIIGILFFKLSEPRAAIKSL
jgi:hypothetical protein